MDTFQSEKERLKILAIELSGISIGLEAVGKKEISGIIKLGSNAAHKLSDSVCGQGFICNGGNCCSSDHK